MTNFQKLIAIFRQNQKYQRAMFIAFIILALAVIILGAYYFQTNKEKEKVKISERKIQQAKKRERSKQDYKKALTELCSKPLAKASALELNNCYNLKLLEEDVVDWGLSLESATRSAVLPAYCERKISEMKMLEFIECFTLEGP